MKIDLTGRAIVITGASGALGAAYARECANRGAAVLLTDIVAGPLESIVDEISSTGGIARGTVGDIADPALSDELANECLRRWGNISGWVNNAGVQRLQGVESTDTNAVEVMVRVNLLGTIYGSAAAARAMIPQRAGTIINVTSGAQHGMRHLAAYGATKGAVASLTYASAIELADYGIRVNALAPLANTPQSADGDKHFSKLMGQEIRASETLSSPAGVAPVLAFLLSGKAEGITGQVVRFDGTTLSIVRHPEIDSSSAVIRDSWDAEGVAAAFDDSLRKALYTNTFASPARQVSGQEAG